MMGARKATGVRWERRPEARPQELLEAALHVFAERGYRNARLEEVAAAAGVTKGALYHYYANKEELLLRALEHYATRAFGRVDVALRDMAGPASARLRIAMRALFGGQSATRREVLLLLQSVRHEVPQAYREWLASGPIKGWRMLTRLIEEGQADGEFRLDADAEVAARVFFTGLMVQLMWQPLAPEVKGLAVNPDRLIETSVDLLLASLQPRR